MHVTSNGANAELSLDKSSGNSRRGFCESIRDCFFVSRLIWSFRLQVPDCCRETNIATASSMRL